jgi:Fic family protein
LETLPVSLRLIRELHEQLMAGVRGGYATPGEFRRTQNWIGRPGCTLNDARFVPPAVPEMKQALDAFEKYLHAAEDYPPLIRLALLHYQFEAIHPFVDGNGRIGRLLLSLLLVHWGLLPFPLLYLSAYYEQNRTEYYDLLLAVSSRGAWHAWLAFFLEGIAIQAIDAGRRAKELQDLRSQWQQRLQQERASALLGGIVDSLFEQPIVSAREIQAKWQVTHPTANKALRRLTDMEILVSARRNGRQRLYLAEAVLEILR